MRLEVKKLVLIFSELEKSFKKSEKIFGNADFKMYISSIKNNEAKTSNI